MAAACLNSPGVIDRSDKAGERRVYVRGWRGGGVEGDQSLNLTGRGK